MSDGRFFWRLDAADYMEHYGVALPEAFLAHGAVRQWTCRPLTGDEVIEVDDRLGELRRAGAL
ncbi:hypothetical protein [Streptomyces sp. NPDC002952]|uniref:hypothetical protein n=1 Tax=Streptomyces sp. NPDC002952 TaxID=3364673 RepID=UPI0036B5EEAA